MRGIYSDCSILVLKNSYEENFSIKFFDVFPTSIGPVGFSSQDASDTILTSDVTFSYTTFEIVR